MITKSLRALLWTVLGIPGPSLHGCHENTGTKSNAFHFLFQPSGYKISITSSHHHQRTQHPMHPSHLLPDPSCLSRLLLPSFLAQVNRQFEPLLSVLQVFVLFKTYQKHNTMSQNFLISNYQKTYLSNLYFTNQEHVVDYHQTIKNLLIPYLCICILFNNVLNWVLSLLCRSITLGGCLWMCDMYEACI